MSRATKMSIVGGLTFMIVWIALELLTAEDPSYLNGVWGGLAAGAAWYFSEWYFRPSE